MDFDVVDYVIRYDCLYNTGNYFYKDAFKSNDGLNVPIIRSHNFWENIQSECFGIAILENRDDGLIAKCKFNETDMGKIARDVVKDKDYGLSIYANGIDYDTLGYPAMVKHIKSGHVLAVILVPMAAMSRPKVSDAGDK